MADLPPWERSWLRLQYRLRCVVEMPAFHVFFLLCILGNTLVMAVTYNTMSAG